MEGKVLTHIVFMRFDTEENALEAARRLSGLADTVPWIRSLRVGLNEFESSRAFDLALVVEFDSPEDLESYRQHPDHVQVARFLATCRTESASCDFWVEGAARAESGPWS